MPVSGLENGVAALTAGGATTCALTTAGGITCWGYNYFGQLGDGTTATRKTPAAVNGMESGASAVSVFGNHTCALTTGGGVKCWGENTSGQVGDGTTTQRVTPTPVSGFGSGALRLAVGGGYHTCVLTTGWGPVCWGSDSRGEVGTGARLLETSPVGVYGFGGPITVDAITPARGSPSGGMVVTITGDYFLQGATVTIGGIAPNEATVLNTTEIFVTGYPCCRAVDVVVRNPDGQAVTLPGGFTYVEGVPSFTDDPLMPRATILKTIHLTELRQAINALRLRVSLGPFVWTDDSVVPGVTPAKLAHLIESRRSLGEVHAAAGRTPPTYTHSTLTGRVSVITAVDFAELRGAIQAIW